jgi:HEAT repeat protein
VLLEELIHLHENFTGETAIRLELIYRKLDFHRDSIRKLTNRKWFMVAKGLRELALMNVRESTEKMLRFINSRNELLRMEARIALVKLNDNDPLFFLSKEKTMLSAWDMANLHAMLAKLPEDRVPVFSNWLNSTNKSVVLFCISMIGAFRQTDSIPVLLRLLDQPDESIKQAAIRSLREMNSTHAEEKLIAMYPLETTEVQNEILKSLEALSSERSIVLYDQILRQPLPDLNHALHSVKALLALGERGKNILEKLNEVKNDRLQLIIQHASDPRL